MEILASLIVDPEEETIRSDSQKCLKNLLQVILLKQKIAPNFDERNLFRLVVDQVQQEIFNLTEKLSNRSKVFDEKSLEKDLAKLHGHLELLKEIEESRFEHKIWLGK